MSEQPDVKQFDPLELLTVDDLVRLLKVKKSWVYDAHSRGELPGRKVGKQHLRFRRCDVETYLTSL